MPEGTIDWASFGCYVNSTEVMDLAAGDWRCRRRFNLPYRIELQRHAEALGRNAKKCREMAGQNRTSLSYKIDVDIEEENLLILVLDVTQGSVQCNTICNGLQPRNKPDLNNSYQNSKGAQIENNAAYLVVSGVRFA